MPPEPRYRGESWQSSILRADREAAEAERRSAATAHPHPARHRTAPRPLPPPEPHPPVTAPAPTPPRRTWRDLNPDKLNRYALARTESRRP